MVNSNVESSRVWRSVQRYQKGAGFTLIELLVAMAVITVGVTGALSLLIHSIASAQAVRNEVIGANLAQEALEIVHSIRDQSVADGRSWSDGLTVGQVFRVEAFQGGLLSRDDGATLNLDADGFYTYGAGTKTLFQRTVAFDAYSDPARDRKVTITVTWPGRTLTATSVITAWR
ncbi:prepilin-type N-terminal cleavage/methylation domain-containing protein [Candidatus Parcubacteria bacterium]|nr:prepilin-type N-terminal cleavage/methylation domain-containing protein [Candidatus Parcubacteria bacterium]MBI4099129.1 prepilin-type N-terminal cleavage/methylation domain-containing protein [Candidatus Parcubacteria bacterium]MBI4385368.1 prepilin-type N-terminal cleavage/methylation domain-containing protein [Candidatus Parcubacteria bacterium]